MWLLYQTLYGLALLVATPWLLLRRGSHYLQTLPGRLTFQAPHEPGGGGRRGAARRPLWLHAVSVGEVAVAATLAAGLPEDEPLLVTTVTPTGQARARKLFADRATVAYLPFELGFAVSRFFRRHRPRALVLVEGDHWPLVLAQARRRGLPVTVVNGRVGDASFRRQARLARLPLLRRLPGLLLDPVDRFGVQSGEDRRRLVRLGVDGERIAVTGNLKFDTPEPAPLPELEARLEELAAGRPLLVVGSTMAAPGGGPAEEERVLDAFREAGGGDRAMMVLAPRHPERWDEVERLLTRRGVAAVRRSRLGGGAGPPAVVLLDTLGELASLYRSAAAAFIGGTLVPTGGHNPLEAARFGVPLAVGPSQDNFRDVAALFDAAGAWRKVPDAAALGRVWREWLEDPAAARRVGGRARALVEENRGSLERTLDLLRPLLAPPAEAAPADPAAVRESGRESGPETARESS